MSYRSNLSAVRARIRQAQAAGLVAAAYVLVNAVKRGLRGGYKTGAFVTGHVLNSVTRSDVMEVDGVLVIKVGSNVPYALYWEVGHMNLFTRRYERKEVWVPALNENRDAIFAAYERAFRAAFG